MDELNVLNENQAAEVAGGSNGRPDQDISHNMGTTWVVGPYFMYRIARGDSLGTIAAKFRNDSRFYRNGKYVITPEYLQRINNAYYGSYRIPNIGMIYAGDDLLIYDFNNFYI